MARGPKVVTDMDIARGLNAGKNAFFHGILLTEKSVA